MNAAGGILLVDKPSGVTSFAVVDHLRRALIQAFPELSAQSRATDRGRGGPRPPRFKCGHAGTLDPLATGLLIVLVGKGSRLAPFLMGMDKTYAATIRFGSGTDTLDGLGKILATGPVPDSPEIVADALIGFRGDIMQIPPVYSALKKEGRPLYERAHAGQDVAEPDPRPVTIHRLDLKATRWGVPAEDPVFEVDLEIACSSGTYIRSLARDLARSVGSEGHLHSLRRLDVGPFSVEDALDDPLAQEAELLENALIPLSGALPHVPAMTLADHEAAALRQGRQPDPEWLERLDRVPEVSGKSGRLFRMLDGTGELVAVGKLETGTGMPRIAAVIAKENQTTC